MVPRPPPALPIAGAPEPPAAPPWIVPLLVSVPIVPELYMPVPPNALVTPVPLPPAIVPELVRVWIIFLLTNPRPPHPSAADELASPPPIIPMLVRVVIVP